MSVTSSTPLARIDDVKQAMGPGRDVDAIPGLLQNPMTLADLEDRYIEGVLKKVAGNKLKAAEILGVDPSTLYRRDKRGY